MSSSVTWKNGKRMELNDHAGEVLTGAGLPPKAVVDTVSYNCPKCQDIGIIIPDSANLTTDCLHSMGEPCDCEAGDEYR